MLFSSAGLKKTKGGKVIKVVREHYLRTDIYCGSPLAAPEHRGPDLEACILSATPDAYLVVDANVALHQLDFLESPHVCDVVVLTVVLEEVRKRNLSAHGRLLALCKQPSRRFFVFANEHHAETYVAAQPGESASERNDRAVRVATAWYARVCPQARVLLLLQDGARCAAARQAGLTALRVCEYAAGRADAPALVDLVAGGGGEEGSDAEEAAPGGRPVKRARLFTEHLGLFEISAGLREGRLLQGALRVSRFNPFEAWLGVEALGKDVLVQGREDMNRAMDGDVVALELLPEAQWRGASALLPSPAAAGTEAGAEAEEGGDASLLQVAPGEHYGGEDGGLGLTARQGGAAPPCGRVVGILRRAWRERGYAGSLQPPGEGRGGARGGGSESHLFVPVERRFPKVRVRTRQAAALAAQRIVVCIDEWAADSAYPSGHYVRSLGPAGDRDTETEVLVHEHDIETRPFSEAVHACVPPLPWSLPPAALAEAGRADLRGLLVCSVDPPGCRDIDDALHARALPNGRWEVGVHIADVTAFLQSGSAMDEEAARRGTSTYLVQRRIDMLPKALTEDICSLRAGVERLTFSVLWELDEEANVHAVRFTRAVIRSSAALSYQEAQARMDDKGAEDELTKSLRTLNALAKRLRARRAQAGALTLASPEVKFVLDSETLDPLDVGMYEVREANQMVEEFMLLANCTVAAKILAAFPACSLLRRHPPPSPRMLEPLLRAAGAAGLTLDVSSSAALGESLDRARRAADPYFNKLLRIMATRCMTQALYCSSGLHAPAEYAHYGLAAPLYTHFTSPIRRYADVQVHRLLGAAIGLSALPAACAESAAVGKLAETLNARHRNAQLAGRASVELHTLLFFRARPAVADARVTRCKANGLIVFVPKFGLEGPVLFAKGESWELEADGAAVSSGVRRFALFDRLAVRIEVETSAVSRRERLLLRLADASELDARDAAK